MMDKKNEKSKPDLSGYHKGYRNLNTYKTDVKASPPEIAANTLTGIIHQANYLLDQQLRQLEKQFLKEGGFTEKLYQAPTV